MCFNNYIRPVAFFVTGLTLIGLATSAPTVQARSGVVPIEIDPDSALAAGKTTAMTLTLSESPVAPVNIRIYTQPAGVVAYQGTAHSQTTTVIVPVNPNARPGSVIVSVSAEGNAISAATRVIK